MKDYKTYEVTIDLSRSTKEEANQLLVMLARNGYSVYFSYDSFEGAGGKKQEICFTTDNNCVTETNKT